MALVWTAVLFCTARPGAEEGEWTVQAKDIHEDPLGGWASGASRPVLDA